jgi:autotransporter family porin
MPFAVADRSSATLLLSVVVVFLGSLSALVTSPALAVCNNHDPVSGQTVVCDTADPNPDPTRVQAVPGSTNVTVNVLPGAAIVSPLNIAVSVSGRATISNAGTITGQTGISVATGPAIVTNSGAISGSTGIAVQFGHGSDTFTMRAGVITGTVQQADGVDNFTMSGGQINGDVDQGSGHDAFFLSAGTITGAFTDGDDVTIIGGSIGSVNLRAGDNVMTMSGGTIVGSVIAEQGADTFNFSGGSIGGNVDLGNGNNVGVVTGGQIAGMYITGMGADQFTWSDGGTIGGLNLGNGNDTATLRNLTPANLTPSIPVSGGLGLDRLRWENVQAADVGQLTSWELIELTNGSQLTFSGTLTLGDSGTGTGTLSVDATSSVFASGSNHVIMPFTPELSVTVNNAGTIDLTNGPETVTDSLTVIGNYVGQGGRLVVQTTLAGEGAPSDRLIISTGTATGGTGLIVKNVGGTGDLTVANGILVVDTVNGGTTAPGAFALAGPVVAGPYEYTLPLQRRCQQPGSLVSALQRRLLGGESADPALSGSICAAQPARVSRPQLPS